MIPANFPIASELILLSNISAFEILTLLVFIRACKLREYVRVHVCVYVSLHLYLSVRDFFLPVHCSL